MVWLIAFLTVSNIALGYGLAIYVHRHFGTFLIIRSKSPLPVLSTSSEAEVTVELKCDLPAVVEATPAVESVAAQGEQPAATTQVAAADTVDEENVLAGIEQFRSQLAKMNEPQTADAQESEQDLVGAAN